MNGMVRIVVALVVSCGIFSMNARDAPAVHDPEISLHVPEGFSVEKVAGAPAVNFPMFAAFDDQGRLFVAESSGNDLYHELKTQARNCRISLLEDTTGDGRFDSARVFADQLVFPMGLVWRDGKLYAPDPPDLLVFEDRKGDGMADRREVLLTGFGHLDNGSLHGLTFGRDGLLYMTMGTPDGYRLQREDGTLIEGTSGALIRCRPDGSQVEVVCRGFENLVEVIFTLRGDMIGTDNWWQRPLGGIRDALVHLAEGGLYPYHPDTGTAFPTTGISLPAITLLPAVAVSGLEISSSISFPEEMLGNIFSAHFNSRKVVRHRLIPEGPTFRTEDFDFVWSDHPDFHPSDVLLDSDGSLLVVDTGGWYVDHCPTGKIRKSQARGGIYRVRYQPAAPVPDPWGKTISWNDLSPDRLLDLLKDSRPWVRDRAQRTLPGRRENSWPALDKFLRSSVDTRAKQHVLWALAEMESAETLPLLRQTLQSGNPDLMIPAARVLRLKSDPHSRTLLEQQLAHESAAVRFAAAQALATCGSSDSLPAIWSALRGEEMDPFNEHALVLAVFFLADEPALKAALKDPHARVQRTALQLLGRPPHQTLPANEVLARLASADRDLRHTALELLKMNPSWDREAAQFAGEQLRKSGLHEEEKRGLASLLLAFQNRPAIQNVITQHLNSDRAEEESMHVSGPLFLLQFFQQTHLKPFPENWISALNKWIDHPALQTETVRVIAVLQLAGFDSKLKSLAADPEQGAELRLEALRALILRQPRLSPAEYDFLLAQAGTAVNPLNRLAAAEVLSRAELLREQGEALARAVQGHPVISPSLLVPALLSPEAKMSPVLFDYFSEAVRSGWRPSDEERKKILEKSPENPAIAQTIENWARVREQELERLEIFTPLLKGGNEERGRHLFFSQKTACASCHRIGEEGSLLGPDLTRIGAIRSGRDLLESILLPSSTFAQGYESYSVILRDGREFFGILSRQHSDGIVLRDAGGAESVIHRESIAEMKRSAVSMMPEGLESALTGEEFQDLLAFLMQLK
jgi:putative membrane-bound dehydrogenase-like protein